MSDINAFEALYYLERSFVRLHEPIVRVIEIHAPSQAVSVCSVRRLDARLYAQYNKLDRILLDLGDNVFQVICIHRTSSIGNQNNPPSILQFLAVCRDHLNCNDKCGYRWRVSMSNATPGGD